MTGPQPGTMRRDEHGNDWVFWVNEYQKRFWRRVRDGELRPYMGDMRPPSPKRQGPPIAQDMDHGPFDGYDA